MPDVPLAPLLSAHTGVRGEGLGWREEGGVTQYPAAQECALPTSGAGMWGIWWLSRVVAAIYMAGTVTATGVEVGVGSCGWERMVPAGLCWLSSGDSLRENGGFCRESRKIRAGLSGGQALEDPRCQQAKLDLHPEAAERPCCGTETEVGGNCPGPLLQ